MVNAPRENIDRSFVPPLSSGEEELKRQIAEKKRIAEFADSGVLYEQPKDAEEIIPNDPVAYNIDGLITEELEKQETGIVDDPKIILGEDGMPKNKQEKEILMKKGAMGLLRYRNEIKKQNLLPIELKPNMKMAGGRKEIPIEVKLTKEKTYINQQDDGERARTNNKKITMAKPIGTIQTAELKKPTDQTELSNVTMTILDQIVEANVTNREIKKLYQDLKHAGVFSSSALHIERRAYLIRQIKQLATKPEELKTFLLNLKSEKDNKEAAPTRPKALLRKRLYDTVETAGLPTDTPQTAKRGLWGTIKNFFSK